MPERRWWRIKVRGLAYPPLPHGTRTHPPLPYGTRTHPPLPHGTRTHAPLPHTPRYPNPSTPTPGGTRTQVRGLAQLRDWPALWLFYNSARRPPLSAAAFAEAAIANGAPAEAARYAPRMPPAEAVPLLLQCGEASAARAIALANKDKNPELLRRVSAHLGAAP